MNMLLCLLLITLSLGQLHGQETAPNAATKACHRMLAGLADKDSTFFSTWEDAKASATLDEIEKCARESYAQLTKYDLAVAVVVTGWLTAKVKDDEIQATAEDNRGLHAKLAQLATAGSTTSPSELQVTIETLPSSFTRTLSIGDSLDKCASDGPESIKCDKFVANSGYWPDTGLVAMLARVKTSYGSTSYLIGCPPSPNCAPLVPGEYAATMSGDDGIVVSGLVAEDKGHDAPHHGIYTILSRD